MKNKRENSNSICFAAVTRHLQITVCFTLLLIFCFFFISCQYGLDIEALRPKPKKLDALTGTVSITGNPYVGQTLSVDISKLSKPYCRCLANSRTAGLWRSVI